MSNSGANASGYSVDAATGALTAISGSPFALGGANPNSFSIDATGKYAFVTFAGGAQVAVFSINESGQLQQMQTVATPGSTNTFGALLTQTMFVSELP